MARTIVYFASDVHLGNRSANHIDRQTRFVEFLRSINNENTLALYLLGDIWDFWYEWKSTVPKGYVKVFAAIVDLIDSGVKVYYTEGNHDIWAYGYFKELGMEYFPQPAFLELGGKKFCLLHGDRICFTRAKYRFMEWLFRNRVIQWMFSNLIHPSLAMKLGNALISNNHLARMKPYVWKGESEPLMQYAAQVASHSDIDYFIFGHLHVRVEETLPSGAKMFILESWVHGSAAMSFDTVSGEMKRL